MTQAPQRVPYGLADYTAILAKDMVYVDNTKYIASLEESGEFLFFLRPRRFGKSLFLSILHCYYDVNYADRFEDLFGKTWIGQNPTAEKGGYLILPFDFSQVRADPDKVEASFEQYCSQMFRDFAKRYESYLDEEIYHYLTHSENAAGSLKELTLYTARKDLKLYVLIDEYDNFTNTILAIPMKGATVYHELTHGEGFFRNFFKTLKGGAAGPQSGLARLFITGVSPVTMDDVTSGFNIGIPVSMDPNLYDLVGFSSDQVREMLEQQGTCDILKMEPDAVLDVMADWYGGYGFSTNQAQSVFNSDMVLYFLRAVRVFGTLPDNMIDHNVRIDYGKLRYLVIADRKLNGNFSRLKSILDDGFCYAKVTTGFPLEHLTHEENFISLLYYLGLLTIKESKRGRTKLVIPNKTIEQLMYGYIRHAMEDGRVFKTSVTAVEDTIVAMGWDGEWRPFFEWMAKAVEEQTSVRDFIDGENLIKAFLLAWLNMSQFFLTFSESEMNKGFCDLYLEPFTAKHPDMRYGYLIELKYIKRGKWTQAKQDEEIAEARRQLTQYRQDKRLANVHGDITWICPIVVFHGWELVAMETL